LLDCREFDFVGDDDEFMIILSNNNVINIYFWKLNLKSSINFNELLESKYLDKTNDSIDIEFKDKRAFGVHCNTPWTFNLAEHDFNKLVEKEKDNNNQNTSNENVKLIEKFKSIGMIYENLSVDIDRKLDASTQNWNL